MSGCHAPECLSTCCNKMKEDIGLLKIQMQDCIGEIGELKRKKAQADLVAHHYIETHKTLEDLKDRVKDIEYRLGHIIELPTELDIRLQDVERKLDGLGNGYVKLKKDFEAKLDVDYKKWVQYFNEVHLPKKPHKCPVCDGCGNDKGTTESNPNFQFCMKYASCHACEGKGIIWG